MNKINFFKHTKISCLNNNSLKHHLKKFRGVKFKNKNNFQKPPIKTFLEIMKKYFFI